MNRARHWATLLLAAGLALALASGLGACDGASEDNAALAPTQPAPSTAVPGELPAPATPAPPTERLRPPPTPTPDGPIPEPETHVPADGGRLEVPAAETAAAEPEPSALLAVPPSQSMRLSTFPAAKRDTPPGTYTTITVGSWHACALTAADAVCWGLRSGTPWDTPAGPYRDITAAGSDTCAIRSSGEIVCWGANGEPDSSRDAPPGRYTALSMMADYDYARALTNGGEAVCWGGGLRAPPPDPPPGTYSTISVGSFKSGLGDFSVTACALTSAGAVVCWEGVRETGLSPQRVDEYPNDYDYRAVDVKGSGVCALTATGELMSGDQGTFGGGINDRCGLPTPEGSDRYAAVSAGKNYTCALTDAGVAECVTHSWFWEGKAQVMQPPLSAGDDRYTTISVGDHHGACALTEAGAAVCWMAGDNKVPHPDPAPGPYIAVSDGFGHTCALTELGDAVCWGWNNFGQAEVPSGRYAVIQAGVTQTCAITQAGEPVCWGWDHWIADFPAVPTRTSA